MKYFVNKYTGEIFLVLSSLAYAFEWFFIRNLSNHGYSTFDITFIRAFGALLILLIILSIFFRSVLSFDTVSKSDIKYFALMGIIAVLTNVLMNLAFVYTSVANVLIIMYLSVFWSIIFGFIFLKEKSSVRKIICTAIAFIGICLALAKGENKLALSIGIGEALALFVSIAWTMDSVIARKIKHTNPFFRMLFIYTVMSFVTLAIIVSLHNFSYLQKFVSPGFLIYGLGLAVTSGILGKGLMYLGINYVPVSTALVIMLLEPISQMTTAYFFAGESISLINMLGIIVVFVMVLSISRKPQENGGGENVECV